MSEEIVANRYLLKNLLGKGGMGAVYEADDRLTGHRVALKRVTIDTTLLEFNTRADQSQSALALAHEFRTLASLRHPHIISVLDYGFDAEHQPFFTMNLLTGAQTVEEAAKTRDLGGKVQLLIQLLQALAYLHRRGIVHRDIKPSNVLVDNQQEVRVLDFGLAVEAEKSKDRAGTLRYMSPEVLMGSSATLASDLYAVGVLAYEMLSGKHPFESESISDLISKVLHSQPDIRAVPQEKTDALLPFEHILLRLLAKNPAERYASAGDVIAVLCQAINEPLPAESIEIRESFLQAAQFVGREQELKTLQAALEKAVAGQGSGYLVGGESGVGKSRLLDELRIRAMVSRTIVARGQGVEGGGLPYHLWRDVLRRLVLSASLTDTEVGILKEIVSDIGTLLGREVPDPPELTGNEGQRRLALTVVEVFRRQTQPVFLLMEDLQWADESLTLLKWLLNAVQELPLLIVGSYRNDESPELPAELPIMQVIPLERLSETGIAELSASMLGEAGRQPNVVSLLTHETEGNVFFLVEVVRALAEEAGSLSSIGKVTLPQSVFAGGIQRIIRRRLARVPDWGQELLKLAAVAGRQIDFDLLNHLLKTVILPDLDSWLQACTEAAVLEAQGENWRFSHDKLREAVLDSLSEDERIHLNKQVAEAIEVVYADDLKPHAALLVRHWAAAKDTLKEGHYSLMAADLAFEKNAYRESLRLLHRAMEIKSYQSSDHPQKALAELYNKMGNAALRLSEFDAARRYQNTALEIYQQINDPLGIRNAISEIGDIDLRQGNYDAARKLFEQSLEISRRLNERKKIAYDLMNLGNLAQVQENLTDSLKIREECLDIMRDVGTPVDIARALNNLALSHDLLGNKERALEIHHEALAIRRQINEPQGIAYSLVNMAAIAQEQKEYDKAREMLVEGLVLLRQVGEQMGIASVISILGDIALETGDLNTAQQHMTESLVIRRELGEKHGLAFSLSKLGEIALKFSDFPTALRYFRESLEVRVQLDVLPQKLAGLDGFARAFETMGNWADALEILMFLQAQPELPGMIQELETRLATVRGHLAPEADASAAPSLDELITKLLRENPD